MIILPAEDSEAALGRRDEVVLLHAMMMRHGLAHI